MPACTLICKHLFVEKKYNAKKEFMETERLEIMTSLCIATEKGYMCPRNTMSDCQLFPKRKWLGNDPNIAYPTEYS